MSTKLNLVKKGMYWPRVRRQASAVRHLFWPIYGSAEHKKIVPMVLVSFLIALVYNLMRPVKTLLVINASELGASIIPFLKLWMVLPGAILVTYLYTKLTQKFKRNTIFYVTIIFFMMSYLICAVVLFPYQKFWALDALADRLEQWLPSAMLGFCILIRHWYFTVFYVLSELWSSVVLSMLFWGFANEVTTLEEAKRFYGSFVLSSNVSGIVAGTLGKCLIFKEPLRYLPYAHDRILQSVFAIVMFSFFCSLAIMGLYACFSRVFNATNHSPRLEERAMKEKTSLLQAMRSIGKSKYLLYVTIMVVAYNIIYNLSEVIWADQIKQVARGDFQVFTNYMNEVAQLTGLISALMAIFICGNVVQFFGWTKAALIAPLVWLITGLCFFMAWFGRESSVFSHIAAHFGMGLAPFISMLSSLQICLGRATKYTVFDETKEIAFIPLSVQEQRKGKAIVDGVTIWVGRSGGALIFQILFLCGVVGIENTIPWVVLIFFLMLACWIYAVLKLGEKIEASTDLVKTNASVV